ncbi:BTAD domain-containing putative transcriptional regulator [Streptomyces leeuwenhoekii]|uniref:AfsR/SARP family transcriptional regulator n=1 Tax=Streptomyces leeuwenhoekii TaxID=1437453 RepID=UPI0036FA0A1E
MPRTTVKLLGSFEVESQGRIITISSGRQRTLLSVLALEAGQLVPTERLAEHLWGEEPPPSSRTTIRGYILRLRRALSPRTAREARPVIASGRHGYQLLLPPESVDVHQFNSLAARAAAARDSDGENDLLRRALSLWRGPALCDVPGDALHRGVLPALEERRLQVLERSVEVALARGEHAQAVVELRRLVAEHPLRDGLWGQLMLALYGAGHQSEAVYQYERCRGILAESLGVDPDPRVRELHRLMLVEDPALGAVRQSAPPLPPSGPVRNTEARSASAMRQDLPSHRLPEAPALFIGREQEQAALSVIAGEEYPGGTRPIIIDGAAGVGKTALALAWAHRAADRFPGGRFYVDLQGFGPADALDPADALMVVLAALGVPPGRLPAGVPARQALVRTRLEGRQALLLLDNAVDAEQVRPLLTGWATVLVTSRDQMRGLVVSDGARRLTLDRLTPVAAQHLLTALIGHERGGAQAEALGDLASLCGCSPLALRAIAESATRWNGLPLEELAAGLRGAPCWLSSLRTGEDRTDPVSVLSWSYDKLGPAPARLYRAFGSYRERRVTAVAAAGFAGVPVSAATEQLDALARLHLVEERVPGCFDLDELPRAFARLLPRTSDGAG